MAPKAKAAASKAAAAKRLPRRAAELPRARAVGKAKARAKSKPPDDAETKSTEPSIADRVIACFKKFDVNGDGKISRGELRAVFTYLDVPPLDVDEFMTMLDKNGDGVLDYSEFTGWLFEASTLANEVLDKYVARVAEQTAAKERLDLALVHLHHAERAAEKSQPVDVWFEKGDDIGLSFGKGDEKMSNMVTTAKAVGAAYAAGVREAWRVLQVGDVEVQETSYVPDLIMEARLTGGVLVKFMPADAMERQRAAEASLPSLRAAVDQARLVLEKLFQSIVVDEESKDEAKKIIEEKMKEGPEPEPGPEEFGVPPPWVKVQYYDYREPFHAPEGCLSASAIDEVYGLSDAMPGCKIMLADWRPGNTHILDYDDVDSGTSPLVEEVEGTFRGLEAECIYFLLVQENGELRKKEIAARRAKKEAERLEDIRRRVPHDCAKEQVFGGLEVSEAEQHPWVNGHYSFCGSKGPRPRFINTIMRPDSGRSIIEFEGKWRIVASEDDFIPLPPLYTPAGDEPGFLPPSGNWPSCTDLSHAKVAVNRKTVCRICDPRSGDVGSHGSGTSFMFLD